MKNPNWCLPREPITIASHALWPGAVARGKRELRACCANSRDYLPQTAETADGYRATSALIRRGSCKFGVTARGQLGGTQRTATTLAHLFFVVEDIDHRTDWL